MEICITDNNETHLGLHVKYLYFLPDFDHVFIKVPSINLHGKQSRYMHTDGHDVKRRFSRLCKRSLKKTFLLQQTFVHQGITGNIKYLIQFYI
jgi:hypothetical protein